MEMKGIVTGIVLTLVSIAGALAQAPSNTRVAVRETYKCEVSELDDYKHAHFNRAIHDRDNQRINVKRESISYQRNYKQQAGAPDREVDEIIISPAAREKFVPEEDVVVRQRDYKRASFI